MDSKLQVPFICQFHRHALSYEEMIVAQAKLNPVTRRQDRTQRRSIGSWLAMIPAQNQGDA